MVSRCIYHYGDKYSMRINKRWLTSLFYKEQDTVPIIQSKVSTAI